MNDKNPTPIDPVQSTSLGKEFHLDPTAYTMVKLDLFPSGAKLGDPPVSGKPYDLRPQTNTVIINEGINQNAVHVSIGILDSLGVIDNLRIQGGEKVDLHIQQKVKQTIIKGKKREDVQKDIELELYVSDIKDFEKFNIDTQTYIIECVTESAYINQLTVLNEDFDGVPGELIKDIAKGTLKIESDIIDNFAPNIQSMKKLVEVGLEPQAASFERKHGKEIQALGGQSDRGYGKPIKGIYPKIRPFAAINWLLRNANDAGAPVFFFESVLCGHRLLSWEDLVYGWDPYEGEQYTNSPLPEKGEKITTENLEWYDRKRRIISVIKSSLGLSKFNDVKQGAYASNLTAVDISTKNYKSGKKGKVYDYKEDQMAKLNKYKPFSTKPEFHDGPFHKNKNSRNFFISQNKYAFDTDNYHSAIELGDIQKKTSYIANMDMLTHTILLPGDPILTAGSKIELKIWKLQNFSEKDKLIDKQIEGDQLMSGKFIIRQLSHIFSPEGYSMELDCIKDSSLVDLDEEYTL
tara:strand:+ start:483 stop:2039 length:1557 start_codon:yes stop_codon:yes gene_type:complete